MTDMPDSKAVSALEALLEKERIALLDGDLDSVASLIARKEELVQELGVSVDDTTQLAHLRREFDRNQVLLDSALSGIRRVASRFATLQRIRETLDTYDRDGRRRSIASDTVHKVEKRA